MATEIEKAYQYCKSVTRLHAKSFYFAAKFLPREKQLPIYALYALCRHIDDEIDEADVNNESEAVAAVENWRRRLNEIYDENDSGKTTVAADAKHELVFTAWRDLLKTYKIPQKLPLELMKGVLSDTYVKRYDTFDELYVYCWRVASTVGLMSSEIFGYSDVSALPYAEALGIAMQLTNILRDVGEDAAMGRIYLPAEELARFGVSEAQIEAQIADENFKELVKFQIERARFYYAEAEKGIPMLDRSARLPVLIAARLYAKILDEIEKQNYDVFAKRAHTTLRQKIFALPGIRREAKKM